MTRYGDVIECTCVSVATATLVIVDQLHTVEAAGSVAGPGEAFIQIALTVFANESRRAGACVTADAVHALSSIPTARLPGARLGRTVIHIHLTLEPYRAKSRKMNDVSYSTFQDSILCALNIIYRGFQLIKSPVNHF